MECEVWSWNVDLCSLDLWNVELRIMKCGKMNESMNLIHFSICSIVQVSVGCNQV